jgi:glucokinase
MSDMLRHRARIDQYGQRREASMTTTGDLAILADIGGTNARFALSKGAEIGRPATFSVEDHGSLVDAVRAFLDGPAAGHRPKRALIAAAGPVVKGRIVLTNSPWTVDPEHIRHGLQLDDVRVLNDFEALAWSLPRLGAEDLFFVGVDGPGQGARAVMGPGSGFGLSALASGEGGWVALVTEGGHATLSSENEREDALIRALRQQLPHVSVEHVLSGPGIARLYLASAQVDGVAVERRRSSDIVKHALAGDCQRSHETLELFCAFLGSVAGNIALTLGAQGGLFIGGGIVPRFAEFLRRSAFRERFEAKGRMASYLRRIPTAVIMHPHPAFLGLSYLARAAHP